MALREVARGLQSLDVRHAASLPTAALQARPRTQVTIPSGRPVVQSGFSLDRLCAPIERSGSKAAQLAARRREKQRKRTLYYLNLSCPPVRS